MYGGLYPRSNVERLYLPRSEGGSGVVSIENCVMMKGKTQHSMLLEVMKNLPSLQQQN